MNNSVAVFKPIEETSWRANIEVNPMMNIPPMIRFVKRTISTDNMRKIDKRFLQEIYTDNPIACEKNLLLKQLEYAITKNTNLVFPNTVKTSSDFPTDIQTPIVLLRCRRFCDMLYFFEDCHLSQMMPGYERMPYFLEYTVYIIDGILNTAMVENSSDMATRNNPLKIRITNRVYNQSIIVPIIRWGNFSKLSPCFSYKLPNLKNV